MPVRWLMPVALLCAMLTALACAEREPATAPARFAASRSIAANGLSVSVFVSRQQIGIADRIEVLIEARRESAEPIRWPALLADAQRGSVFPPNPDDPEVSDWSIVDLTRRTFSPGHESIELILEPYLDGDKPIPAFAFLAAGKELVTESIPVTVIAEHAQDADAAPDPLAALAGFEPPLTPLPISRSWLASPFMWALVAAAAGILLCGGAAVALVRTRRRRSPSPDQQLDRILTLGSAAIAGDDTQHVEEVTEKVAGALRIWLVATRRTSPGATGRELTVWVRANSVSSAANLAERLAAYEACRFAPGAKTGLEEARQLVRAVWEFTHELRAEAQRRTLEGGASA